MDFANFLIALLAGMLPALFWLWFWLRQDQKKPEPTGLIVRTFVAGMIVVPLVLPLQKLALGLFGGASLMLVWVIIEETLKYAIALIIVLWHKAVDEPIDYIIYMITIALGFAALENALFIWNPLVAGDISGSIITGNFRFLGATLLHVLASGTVGIFLAFAFYKRDSIKLAAGTFGLFVAIVLHTLFNLFIMDANGETIISVFLIVWLLVILMFMIFEKVKQLEVRHQKRNR
ncbi:MAG: PrsW family glutamic-type intramembrane protease [Candidatus Paceibacterota bacterium]